MKYLFACGLLASVMALAQTNEGARPTPKPDTLPDPIPACPKKAAVFPQGLIFYCPGWAEFVPKELAPAPADADNPSRLRLLVSNASHSAAPPAMAAEAARLAGQ